MKIGKQKRRPTQGDVARLAGVSQALVSQIINNTPHIAVPQETRQRVLDAVTTLGYVPDSTARSLRTRKGYTVASIIPDITNPFYPTFIRGIQDVVDAQGYNLAIYNTDGTAEKEQRYLRLMRERRVDGIIGVFFHSSLEQLLPLLEEDIAIVRLEASSKPVSTLPLDNIYVDNRAAACEIVSYLIAQGHQRIAMIAGQSGPRQARLLGYRQAYVQHQLTLDDTLIVNADFNEQGGYVAMQNLLSGSPHPTAVFAANDLLALGALRAVREAGLHVPQDIAIAGFDDIAAASLVHPALTTISQQERCVGQRAAELLFERLNGLAPIEGRDEKMPHELRIRAST